MLRFPTETLHRVAYAVCRSAGSDPGEADLVADHLVEANLAGHDPYGIGILPDYVEAIRQGRLVPNRHARTVADRGSLLVVDGARGYGQVIGHEAMQLGMARAHEPGIALVAIRNTYHLGRIGHWAEQCARSGFASIHFLGGVRAGSGSPWGAQEESQADRDHRPSTCLCCVGLPGEDGPAVLWDSPAGTTAATEPPGPGLAAICELMAGVLGGGGISDHQRDGGTGHGMLSLVINPDGLVDRDALHTETLAILARLRVAGSLPGSVPGLLPGEADRLRAERLASGIEIDRLSWARIGRAALAAGLSESDLDGLIA
jgi:uncharacterized oxidoreductase